ncbi:MAG: nickel-dependent lactate racemase [Syntrophomonas sp.]
MQVKLPYGRHYISFAIPDQNLMGTLSIPDNLTVNNDNVKLVEDAINNPLGTPSMADIIKKKTAQNAVVVVNDITRPTPYKDMLPPLLQAIEKGGIKRDNIKLLIATGIHRPHTEAENLAIFGPDICADYHIENHNCDDNLVSLGYLSNGMELVVNGNLAKTDLLVTTGMVGLHYFAGYSGGRKSILPGLASRKLIEANHKMMNDKRACLGNYEDNPVSDIMLEAASKAGVDFTLNVVTASKKSIAFAAAGDIFEAWMKAVKYCEAISVVNIKEKADIVIAGCGGYPKDINMYQSQKALDAAVLSVKEGGTIILVAECSEGMGEETFCKWIEEASCPQDIVDRFNNSFELGGHKAFAICRVLEKAGIMLYSGLPTELVGKMYMSPVKSVDEAISKALEIHGKKASILFMPEAPRIGIKSGPVV